MSLYVSYPTGYQWKLSYSIDVMWYLKQFIITNWFVSTSIILIRGTNQFYVHDWIPSNIIPDKYWRNYWSVLSSHSCCFVNTIFCYHHGRRQIKVVLVVCIISLIQESNDLKRNKKDVFKFFLLSEVERYPLAYWSQKITQNSYTSFLYQHCNVLVRAK